MTYRVLLYYKYVPIADPAQFVAEQKILCQKLHLKGRILIAQEGLNGTVCGTTEQAEQYKTTLRNDSRFSDIEFKEHDYEVNPFPKLKVKLRQEIVTLGVTDLSPEEAGQHLSPEQWHELAQQDDVVVLDVRNNYESTIGKFQNAITPDIDNFRDLPVWLQKHQELKDKKVLIYCTGGVRCEKASGLLKRSGVQVVYQLHGGIINYGKHIPDGLWQGSCFVFDDRMAVPVNDEEHHQVISECRYCKTPTDTYYNCCNMECNALILLCSDCRAKSNQACSLECAQKPRSGVLQEWQVAHNPHI